MMPVSKVPYCCVACFDASCRGGFLEVAGSESKRCLEYGNPAEPSNETARVSCYSNSSSTTA